ncbi:hypothetical protein QZH41_015284 [Actinostola sp. cb2023]|nr:hypothetical protein QZH41_015284 [Actinostola sp. cb2023]
MISSEIRECFFLFFFLSFSNSFLLCHYAVMPVSSRLDISVYVAEDCENVKSNDGCLKTALGMESKAIPDARITASSYYDGNHAPQQGRLNFQPYGSKQGSWAARNAKAGEWLQVNLGKVTKVTGVATQGRSRVNQWVASYRLQYSLDGKTFKDYTREARCFLETRRAKKP